MQPAITLKPSRRASATSASAFGQPAGLVELDVDRVVAAGEARAGRRRCGGFRRRRPARCGGSPTAPRPRRREAAARSVRPRPRRRPPCWARGPPRDHASLASTISRAAGAASRTAAIRAASPVAAELHLEERPARRRLCRRGHRLRRTEAERVGRLDRPERRQAGDLGGGSAAHLGLEVEQGAVDRVPRRAGRHGAGAAPRGRARRRSPPPLPRSPPRSRRRFSP